MSSILTASQIDRAHACPASFALPSVLLPSGGDADRGTAIHRFLEAAVTISREAALGEVPSDAPWRGTCEGINVGEIVSVAERVESEVAFAYNPLTGEARVLGGSLGRRYHSVHEGEIAGTADLIVTRAEGSVVVADYKTGRHRVFAGGSGQVQLLGLAAARALGLSQVTVTIIHVSEDGLLDFDELLLLPEELDRIQRRVKATFERVLVAKEHVAKGLTPDVTVGDHCAYCPAFRACPANISLARGLLTQGEIAETVGELSPAQAGILWERVRRARSVLDEIDAGLRAYADHAPIPLPDGENEIARVETVREKIIGRAAVPVLEAYLGTAADEVIEPTVSKTGLESFIRSVSDSRRESRAVMNGVMSGLKEAGAVSESVVVSYRPRPLRRHRIGGRPGGARFELEVD